ncbi:hypothetical protein [Kitasatospora sp. NPDC050543]
MDFDRVLAAPDRPERARADLVIEDHLHPNATGYRAMADAFDLRSP